MAIGHKAAELLVTVIVFFVFSWLAVGLRCVVRGRMLKVFGHDDWAMLVTQILYSTFLMSHFVAVGYGMGQHVAELKPQDMQSAMAWLFACEFLYCQTNAALKLALGLFLLRVTIQPRYVLILRSLTAVSVITAEAFSIISLLQCRPISKYWNKDTPGHCIYHETFVTVLYAGCTINIICDLSYGILPYFLMKDLPISRSQKLAVAALMGLGSISSVATVARVVFIYDVDKSLLKDFTYFVSDCSISFIVENGAGIIACSLATLRPLIRRSTSGTLFPKVENILKQRHRRTQLRTLSSSLHVGKSPRFAADRTIDRWEEYGSWSRELDCWGMVDGPTTSITAMSPATTKPGKEAWKGGIVLKKGWKKKIEPLDEVVEPANADVPKLVVNVKEEFEVSLK